MALFAKKKKPEESHPVRSDGIFYGKSSPLHDNFQNVIDMVRYAREEHKKWWLGDLGHAKKAQDYYQTHQKPANFPLETKFYTQLNLVKDNHDAFMGILSSAKWGWSVSGKGSDANDKQRVKNMKRTMEWVGEEADLRMMLGDALNDFGLVGIGHILPFFNKYHITSMNTLGMVELMQRSPEDVKIDPTSRHRMARDARFVFHDPRVTKEALKSEIERIRMIYAIDKKFDIDQIVKDAKTKGNFDYDYNRTVKEDRDVRISLITYEYWRWIEKELKDPYSNEPLLGPEGIPLKVPLRDYRIAVIAGKEIIVDYPNPLAEIDSWNNIIIKNNKLPTSPYAISNFPEIEPVQDTLNVMLSMMINSQAKQINSPLLALAGSLGKSPETVLSDIMNQSVLTWNYPEEFRDAGIPMSEARPRRLEHGQMDQGWFQVIAWLLQMSERVSTRDVVKGRESHGAKSGVAINLLQTAALQPHNFSKEKLSYALATLGRAMYHLIVQNIDYEIEIPINDKSDEDESIILNREVSDEEMQEMAGQIESGELNEDGMKMFSVRVGDRRLSLQDYIKENELALLLAPEEVEKQGAKIIENDITFGDYNVSLVIDTMAEQSRAERVARSEVFMQLMQSIGAPMTAIEYGLDVADDPEKQHYLQKIREEIPVFQMAQQILAMQQQQAEEQQNAQQQSGQLPGAAPPAGVGPGSENPAGPGV